MSNKQISRRAAVITQQPWNAHCGFCTVGQRQPGLQIVFDIGYHNHSFWIQIPKRAMDPIPAEIEKLKRVMSKACGATPQLIPAPRLMVGDHAKQRYGRMQSPG